MNSPWQSPDWDSSLQQMNGSILQSRRWAEFQQALGREVIAEQGSGWQWLAAVRKSRGLTYWLASYGPTARSKAMMVKAVENLVAAARTASADFVRIEPQYHAPAAQLRKLKAKAIAELDPTYTRVVDLTPDEDQLRTALDSGHRNRVNGTERRGISIRHSREDSDLELLLEMLHDTARRSGVTFHPDSYFQALFHTLREESLIYVAEAEGEPVAAALLHDWGGTRYYAHAGAYQEKNRRIKASVSLVWQTMMDAKAAGLSHFDLCGIAPEGDDAHHLASLSHFKKGFGGEQVAFCGTWDIPINTSKYHLYGVYRKLRGLV